MPASLLQAKIRGVRSYSPLEENVQTIEFMPLTLIVGSNGSGKTSVIESLKFIISGDEPPLSDSRRNFLHTSRDPKKEGPKSGAYASIELIFQNSHDETCTARRDISRPGPATSVKANPTPSISSAYRIGNGTWRDVHRQDDWSKTIPRLFNLPNQALLNHVILCHQDDNLWCMSDSGTVKQIFDRILGCEQYKREIKHIEAEIKNCKTELSLAERDLVHTEEKVKQKFNLISQKDDLQREILKTKGDIKKLECDIDMIKESKIKVQNQLKSLEKKSQEIVIYRYKMTELNEREVSLRKMLRKPFIDPYEISDIELELKLTENRGIVENTKQKQDEMKKTEETLKSKCSEIESRRDSVQHSINKLKVIELKSQESRGTLTRELESIKNSDENFKVIRPDEIDFSLEKLAEFEKELRQYKSDQAQLEDELMSKRDQLSKEINKLEGSYQGLTQKINSKKCLVDRLSEQLSHQDPMAKDLKKISHNLRKMTGIAAVIPRSAALISLIQPLEGLIDETEGIVNGLMVKVNNTTVKRLAEEIDRETEAIEIAKRELKSIESQRETLKVEHIEVEQSQLKVRASAKEAHNKVVVFQNKRQSILNIYDQYKTELKFIESKNLAERLVELNDLNGQIEEIRLKLSSISKEHSVLTENVSRCFEEYEELKNNIQIRGLIAKSNEIKSKIISLEQQVNDEKLINHFKEELESLNERELKFRDSKSTMAGTLVRIEREVEKTISELKTHSHSNSRHAETLGKVVSNQIILGDLEKLKDCFNKSIITFHEQMIAKINEVLRARWRQIYQGTDIDLIELVDEEIVRNKNQKAFNYYLAMRKGGIRMKMREKSSAGQKALASIILRMTLAELFVKDFAFIALDEPTANLDLANVQSLARAIGNYVKRRARRGANIQWIIITHDEQFLRSLDAESSPYFYRVKLDETGCSKIVKVSYQDAQSIVSSSLGSNPSDNTRSATQGQDEDEE